MQKNNLSMINKLCEWMLASFISILGYLSPLKDIAHMMVFFFVLDIIWGWLADRKLNNAKFSTSKVWHKTMPRMLLSITLLISAFILDVETDQSWVSFYRIVGWIISSLLIISIMKNGFIVTEWKPLKIIENIFKKKIEKEMGMEIDFDDKPKK